MPRTFFFHHVCTRIVFLAWNTADLTGVCLLILMPSLAVYVRAVSCGLGLACCAWTEQTRGAVRERGCVGGGGNQKES